MLVIAGRHSMSKIRINELARELEVKPNIILDILPDLGVADKKTHSSSLDDDVALAIRRRIAGELASTESAPAAEREFQPEAPREVADLPAAATAPEAHAH